MALCAELRFEITSVPISFETYSRGRLVLHDFPAAGQFLDQLHFGDGERRAVGPENIVEPDVRFLGVHLAQESHG